MKPSASDPRAATAGLHRFMRLAERMGREKRWPVSPRAFSLEYRAFLRQMVEELTGIKREYLNDYADAELSQACDRVDEMRRAAGEEVSDAH